MLVKKKRKKYNYQESEDQTTFFKWLAYNPGIRRVSFAIPNAGRRSPFLGKIMKGEGMTAGAPDVFIGLPRNGFHGMFVEQKTKGKKQTPAQEQMFVNLRAVGYHCVLSYSADESIEAVKRYISIRDAAE